MYIRPQKVSSISLASLSGNEIMLFLLALFLGFGVRFLNLGAAPLSDYEARWALQALHVFSPAVASSGAGLELGPQPAYVYLTAATFALFQSSDFAARLWPALAGSLLLLFPFAFRHALGHRAALVLTFGLALDPGLVTTARLAGGPGMALAFLLLAGASWVAGRAWLAGLLAGLALLSGPSLLVGGLPLALTALLFYISRPHPPARPQNDSTELAAVARRALGTASAAAALTVGLVSTAFFSHPQGLGAWASTLPAYLSGWITPSGVPAARLAIALLAYQPFAVIIALVSLFALLVGLALNWEGDPPLLATAWALFSLVLILVYPGRQVTDLVWVLVPVWVLAARQIGDRLLFRHDTQRETVIAAAQGGLLLLLAALSWNTLIAQQITITSFMSLPWTFWRLIVLLGVILLGVLTTLLVSLGWSWTAGRSGMLWGLAAAFSVYTIAALWGASQLRANQPQELWGPPPATLQERLMQATLRDLSDWRTGLPETIQIVSTVDAPSLRWALRDYPKTRFVGQLQSGEQQLASTLPDVVFTSQDQTDLTLGAAYRGQDFAWWVYPGWSGALPPDALNWLTSRQAPINTQFIILWARSDIFPGGTLELNSQP
ncbi:MAG: hypothetical protein AB1894_05835 [Chloroflexota bacterium]